MSKKEETVAKETKKKVSKVEPKVSKKDSKKKKEKEELFFVSVKKEMGKVRWPLKKEMIKYSVATLSFLIFFALFFALGDLLIAGVKVLVG